MSRLSKKYATLTDIAKDVHDNMSVPEELANIDIEIASLYAFFSDEMKDLQIRKSKEWLQIKESGDEKDISDAKADRLYAQRPDGVREIELKYTLRALEKLMGAIKNCSFLNRQESKNEW